MPPASGVQMNGASPPSFGLGVSSSTTRSDETASVARRRHGERAAAPEGVDAAIEQSGAHHWP
jgi:hypothetical protein